MDMTLQRHVYVSFYLEEEEEETKNSWKDWMIGTSSFGDRFEGKKTADLSVTKVLASYQLYKMSRL